MNKLLIGTVPIVLAAIGAGYFVYQRDKPRPHHQQLSEVQQRLAEAQAEEARVKSLPELQPLRENYARVQMLLESCDMTITPEPDPGERVAYTGPSTAWHASAAGDARQSIACMYVASQSYPVTINTLAINGDGITIRYSVLGELNEDQK